MAADKFDFFLVAEGAGVDEFSAFITEDAEGHGGFVALVLVAHEKELGVFLPDFAFGNLEASVVLVGFDKGGNGVGDFEGVAGGTFLRRNGVEEFQDMGGGNGGGATGKASPGGAGNLGGLFSEEVEAGDGFLFFLPADEAGGAPVGKVWLVDGRGGELGGEDFLDGREGVEPGEDVGGAPSVFEAAVEFFADGFGRLAILPMEECCFIFLIFSF